ncbi:hypothetical protein JNUCC1_02412 [Lentibacillus sp. JNUCC-1]|uniref:5,10-methylene-tetrahydrofolate dehydrogenase n=1 Tax=Lentibacillus sp. JNUCC-1 TaxID=2654513 RepID=UPI0012E78D66|nr:5,10-methylene-tetrahydrofolate dehydrogenase [Lentibacillus sp. JNUCC-1]MUV38558.1 hypothetical protein [Lentibacillus sp. JNUCC-1]
MTQEISIGLIAAPELANELANDLIDLLPDSLDEHLPNETVWTVDSVIDPLTGAAENAGDIFKEAVDYRDVRGWNYIICLTDLPVFHKKDIVAVDINETSDVCIVSIPAFGWRPVLHRIKKTIIQVVGEMHGMSGQKENELSDDPQKQQEILSSDLLRRQFPISPVRKVRSLLTETGEVHTRYLVVPKLNGGLRLLSGMTFANNPLKMMSTLTNVIAIAFTTGAFGMIFTTMWRLSHLFTVWRLTGITLTAIFGMVLWVIVAHGLWEKQSSNFNQKSKRLRRLYNMTTVTTLLISVTGYYAVVYLLFFGTALVFIPPDILGETLMLGESAGVQSYLRIAWFAASISTVAGAIGAGLENEQLVRDSTYGYRQYRRYYEANKSYKEEK